MREAYVVTENRTHPDKVHVCFTFHVLLLLRTISD